MICIFDKTKKMTIRQFSTFELPTVQCAKTIPFVERFSPSFRSAVTGDQFPGILQKNSYENESMKSEEF